MLVGCPSEVKVCEFRVGIVPATVVALKALGHEVIIQTNAGVGSGIEDAKYEAAGAKIVNSAAEVWQNAEMLVKVKEPVASEYDSMRPGQILYAFLHLAAEPALTKALLDNQVTAVAYETIQVGNTLPLLKPMSEVAGRLSIQMGAWCLEKQQGGKGLLLGGVPGVSKAKVVIIGGGVVGINAAKIALGMGANVVILDANLSRLEYIDHVFSGNVQTLYSNAYHLAQSLIDADLVVGAVLIAGERAPKLVTRDMLSLMSHHSVIVDVAVDQGGCVETMRGTTHEAPTFIEENVVHYGVTNMPSAVARTSTFALTNATLFYMCELANKGLKACMSDPALAKGLNTFKGKVTCNAVAKSLDIPFVEFEKLV
ncbi:MAG: alanine dehydrogenase [bacterium]|nr:alanine dehydrogenase [bacterium]